MIHPPLPRLQPARKEGDVSVCSAAKRHEAGSCGRRSTCRARVEGADRFLCDGQEIAPRGREFGRHGRAADERRAQPALQLLDPAAEGGLRHVAQLGRAREAGRVGKRHEILQPLDLHIRFLCCTRAAADHKSFNRNRYVDSAWVVAKSELAKPTATFHVASGGNRCRLVRDRQGELRMALGIEADLILINGRIWRGREEGISEALAVWQGKVLATAAMRTFRA